MASLNSCVEGKIEGVNKGIVFLHDSGETASIMFDGTTLSIDKPISAGESSTSSQYIIFTDPVSGLKSRFGARGENPVFDREIIPNGFAGAEGVGWENVGGGITA